MLRNLYNDFPLVYYKESVGELVFSNNSLPFLIYHNFQCIGNIQLLFIGKAFEYLHLLNGVSFYFVLVCF